MPIFLCNIFLLLDLKKIILKRIISSTMFESPKNLISTLAMANDTDYYFWSSAFGSTTAAT